MKKIKIKKRRRFSWNNVIIHDKEKNDPSTSEIGLDIWMWTMGCICYLCHIERILVWICWVSKWIVRQTFFFYKWIVRQTSPHAQGRSETWDCKYLNLKFFIIFSIIFFYIHTNNVFKEKKFSKEDSSYHFSGLLFFESGRNLS